MSRSALRLLGVTMLLAALASRLPAHVLPTGPGGDVSRIRPGFTPDEVQALLGPPKRIARQIVYRRYFEMWSYDRPSAAWIEFRCERGQEPRVATVHSGSAGFR